MMAKFPTTLSLLILLGFWIFVPSYFWIFSNKMDCPSACGEIGLKFAISTRVEADRPSFYICATKVKRNQWQSGFNKTGKNSCTTAFDGEECQGIDYYCLCTNNLRIRTLLSSLNILCTVI